jgi:RNA polymerase sigma-70 factor (ECF subfamily)
VNLKNREIKRKSSCGGPRPNAEGRTICHFARSSCFFLSRIGSRAQFISLMGTTSKPATDQPDERGMLQRAVGGDQAAWAQILAPYRKRLRRMVALRMDQRLRGRIDPSDVLQEAFLQAAQARPEYLKRPEQPLFLWLRWLTGMTLQHLHRRHLGVHARDAGREVQLLDRPWPEATSAALAALLLGRDTRPSVAAIRAERQRRLQEALNGMDPLDRDVLVLRHFEELSNSEVARELQLQESAASKRYIRALHRLKEILASLPGGLEEFRP